MSRKNTNTQKNAQKNNLFFFVPGDGWQLKFQRRNSELTVRIAQKINQAMADVTEEDIRKWFLQTSEYVHKGWKAVGAPGLLMDPSRIFNADEAGFALDAGTGKRNKVVVLQGARQVTKVAPGTKRQVTVLSCIGADGTVIPPYILMKGKSKISTATCEYFRFSDAWYHVTSSGWMTADAFLLWLRKFVEVLKYKDTTFPVVLFVDNHYSHSSEEIALFCYKHDVMLCSLFANSTQLYQPLDVSIFSAVKATWKRELDRWQQEFPGVELTQKNFPEVFRKVWEHITEDPNRFRKAFTACGLFPWNPDMVKWDRLLPENRRPAPKHQPKKSKEPRRVLSLIEYEDESITVYMPAEDRELGPLMLTNLREMGYNATKEVVSDVLHFL